MPSENNKKKLLIVDDSQIDRSILKNILSGYCYIEEAENGYAALELLMGQDDFDGMLLDISMPILDGLMCWTSWIRTTYPSLRSSCPQRRPAKMCDARHAIKSRSSSASLMSRTSFCQEQRRYLALIPKKSSLPCGWKRRPGAGGI